MISITRINDKKVNPIKVPKIENDKIKGFDLFPEIYANIFLCAKKKSGKTSVINKILKECIDKETRLFVFCATHNKDQSYIEIKKMLKKREIRNVFFDAIIDEDGVNNLDLIIEELKKEEPEKETDDETTDDEIEDKICLFDDGKDIKIKITKRKPRKISPKIVFVFDDMSDQLKDRNVPKLLKTNRHFKSKVIVSSQYPYDIEPGSRTQFDYWILFKGHEDAKLEAIHKNAGLPIDFDFFKRLYHGATAGNYNFLYIDTLQNKYRRNFNEEINF